jgi:hypothetical protein
MPCGKAVGQRFHLFTVTYANILNKLSVSSRAAARSHRQRAEGLLAEFSASGRAESWTFQAISSQRKMSRLCTFPQGSAPKIQAPSNG